MNEKQLAQKMKEKYGASDNQLKVEKLKKLDKKVTSSAQVFSLAFGIVGALVLGFGMCLAMKVIFDMFALGIVIGVVGIFMVNINYFIYRSIVRRKTEKYRQEIIDLSNKILSE